MNEESSKLLGSLLLFTQYFFEKRTGREFIITKPLSREPHAIQICRALTKVFYGETKRLLINIEPRSGKTELLISFICWCLAHYPDCNFIYTSYSATLSTKQTETVRQILMLLEFGKLFPWTKLDPSSMAKDDFKTTENGTVFAVGAGGSITGRGAGIKGVKERFGGAILIDDILKPDEAMSDSVRESRIDWFSNTLISRRNNGDNTPIIFIGQRLHEDDLAGRILKGELDGYKWEELILPSIDNDNNILIPDNESVIRSLEKSSPYVFAAQYQQNPVPAGGGIFKKDWFVDLLVEPKIIASFITADTAETEKAWNDATVFSFWGLYKIEQRGVPTEIYGLHWIDCLEIRVEPYELEARFLEFWGDCMRHPVKPLHAFIEKKSTGVTLSSVLNKVKGLVIIPIDRGANQNKITRFINSQPYVRSGQISFTVGAKHATLCKDHMAKITANNSHRHDDIADTLADAVEISLINKSLPMLSLQKSSQGLDYMARNYNRG